ncbi:MAG: glycosyltransferase [Candidatus Eremiobacteraeota bacterium]|nr:glycosyltransferase [Candidatus Eremiobacteraeota bacterium]
MRLAIDALNLRNDRRGMGRIVRAVLQEALAAKIDVTLLTRERKPWGEEATRLASPASASRRALYDAVWYPWNGIRFSAAVPSLAHIHDTFALVDPQRNWIARRRVRKPLWRAAHDATRIATDSRWSRAQICRDLGLKEDEIVVIEPAPDPFFFPAQDDDTPSLPASPYVLIVGAGEPRKNARFFVAAFADAFDGAEVRLVAVGDLADDAVAEARARGIPLVRELADDARLRALYRNAACVAVPSLAEGFGLVVVEAQACGAPVVASNASALPEAAGGAALLVAPDDRTGWRDALRSVVRDASVAARLRALGIARWGFRRRDEPARAILAELANLANDRT